MSSTLYSDILNTIYTDQDRNLILSELRLAKLKIISSSNPQRVLKGSFPEIVYKAIRPDWDKAKVQEFLGNLENRLQALQTLELSIAFDPTPDFTEKVFTWVRKNVGEGVILKFKKDESIIGGTLISFAGRYKDLSVKNRIEERYV